jgi:hypothetical protein
MLWPRSTRPLPDMRSHASAVNAHTRASTNAGVALLLASDVLFASSEARGVVLRRVPHLIGLASLLFSAGGYALPDGTAPIRRPAMRSYEARRGRHQTAGAALGFASSGHLVLAGRHGSAANGRWIDRVTDPNSVRRASRSPLRVAASTQKGPRERRPASDLPRLLPDGLGSAAASRSTAPLV